MRIDVDHQETKEIIESLKKNDKKFLAERFERQLKLEKGKGKHAPMSDSPVTGFTSHKAKWGDKYNK